jgi:hypothetical protein
MLNAIAVRHLPLVTCILFSALRSEAFSAMRERPFTFCN